MGNKIKHRAKSWRQIKLTNGWTTTDPRMAALWYGSTKEKLEALQFVQKQNAKKNIFQKLWGLLK